MRLPATLADFAHAPLASAIATDFDGTLAPIVNDPTRAEALPASIDALRVLAAHLGLVAVISGRPVSFLRERLPVERVVLVGQYGLERLAGDEAVLDPRVAPYVDAVAAAAAEAEQHWPDVLIERKGVVAFTVHWRTAPGREPRSDDLAALAERHGLVTQPGRLACEFRTPVPVDKGTALEGLDLPHGNVAFAGDDEGDLAAFRVQLVSDEASPFPRLVRIAVRSPEAPRALLEEADLIVNGPAGLAELLTDLAATVSGGLRP